VTARTDFVYAQARLQARHGRLPDATAWQALESSRTAGHYLALARAGPLAPWVDALDDAHDVPKVERHFRARWRAHVNEVAAWLPAPWQASVRWFGTLDELPRVEALRRAGHAEPWRALDELQRGEVAAKPAPQPSPQAAGRPDQHSPAALRALHVDGGAGTVAMRWRAEWARRLPHGAGSDDAGLRRPAELLLPRLLDPAGQRGADTAPAWHALQRLFRRHAATPVAVFAHLAIVALVLERLRGGLVVRMLFDRRPVLTVP